MTFLLILLALAVAGALGYVAGRRAIKTPAGTLAASSTESARIGSIRGSTSEAPCASPQLTSEPESTPDTDSARIIEAQAEEITALRGAQCDVAAELTQLIAFKRDRAELQRLLGQSRAETARYRQLVIDVENDAPPPILTTGAGPDDLKLIVGIGPVLERMLHSLGITHFRQIGRWNERDVAEFDAKLAEFRGRIERDQWVVQARALHHATYGEALTPRSSSLR